METSPVGTDVSSPCWRSRISERVETYSTSSSKVDWGKGRDTSVPTGDVSAFFCQRALSHPYRQTGMSERVETYSTSSNMINWGKGRDTSVPTIRRSCIDYHCSSRRDGDEHGPMMSCVSRTWRKAATTLGSYWLPAQRLSSSRAASGDMALR